MVTHSMTNHRQAKREERLASMRWCASCEAFRVVVWDECERCHAVLKKQAPPVAFEKVEFTLPFRTLTRESLLLLLNSGMIRPRKQKVNVETAATPHGEREIVPHTTECPLCQRRPAYGIYRTQYVPSDTHPAGKRQLELACAFCANDVIPRRHMHGVRIVRHCVLWATITCHGHDAWTIDPVSEMR